MIRMIMMIMIMISIIMIKDGIKVYSESKNCGHNDTNGKPMILMMITMIITMLIMLITKMTRLPPLLLDKTGEGKPGETLLASVGFLTVFNFSWFPDNFLFQLVSWQFFISVGFLAIFNFSWFPGRKFLTIFNSSWFPGRKLLMMKQVPVTSRLVTKSLGTGSNEQPEAGALYSTCIF